MESQEMLMEGCGCLSIFVAEDLGEGFGAMGTPCRGPNSVAHLPAAALHSMQMRGFSQNYCNP